MKNYAMQPLFEKLYLSSEIKPIHVNKILDLILKLLKDKQKNSAWRKKNEEKYAKMKSDLNNSRSKVDRLKSQIKDLNKNIGRLENDLSVARGKIRNERSKITNTQTEKEKLKSRKIYSKKLFQHELRKKDNEIAKLKDLLKKSSLMHKDKIESYTRQSRFEINSFYDGTEKEFNILDSKKGGVIEKMVNENNSMRQMFMIIYSEGVKVAQRYRLRVEETLSPQVLNKPFSSISKDVEVAFLYLFGEIGRKLRKG